MKRLYNYFGILVLILFQTISIFPQGKNHYLPLALGNKWQYFKQTYSSYSNSYLYDVELISITDTQTVNNNLYYKYNGTWMRYDENEQRIYILLNNIIDSMAIDFTIPNNTVYNSALGEMTAIGDDVSINGTWYSAKGVRYHNWDISQPTFYETYYVKNFGLSYYDETGHAPGGRNWETHKPLIAFYSADTSIAPSLVNNSSPIISIDSVQITETGDLKIKMLVYHSYSALTRKIPGTPFSNMGVCFIDSVWGDYFYSNGIDTIGKTNITLTKENELYFYKTVAFDYSLITRGYKFYFKVGAKDKSIFQHTTYFPFDGYENLDEVAVINDIKNFYPLKPWNLYVYKLSKKDISGNWVFLNNNYVYFVNDATLSNNKTYSKLLRNNSVTLERFDKTSSCVLIANILPSGEIKEDTTECLWIQKNKSFNKFVNNAYKSYTCNNFANFTLFNTYKAHSKVFAQTDDPSTWYRLLSGIGLVENYYKIGDEYYKEELAAAKIGTTIYGDATLFVGVDESETTLPTEYQLSQNYPNPFNPSTTINFSIKEAGLVTLKVYDVLGREVATLVNEELNSGSHNKSFNASGLSSGIYFYSLKAGKFSETKKLLLLK